jgi:hypothetical protein
VEAEEWDCGEQRDQDEEEVVAVVKWTICVVELQKERFTRSSAACTCSALGCKWRGVYIYNERERGNQRSGPVCRTHPARRHPRRPRRCRMQTCRAEAVVGRSLVASPQVGLGRNNTLLSRCRHDPLRLACQSYCTVRTPSPQVLLRPVKFRGF